MTEKQWLNSTNPRPMLELLGRAASDRQLRLFACACVRRVWHLLVDTRSRAAVEVAERFADGSSDEAEVMRAHENASDVLQSLVNGDEDDVRFAASAASLTPLAGVPLHPAAARTTTVAEICGLSARAAGGLALNLTRAEEKAQAGLMRDLFGNPFKSVRFLPAWRTDTAIALAKQIYESRDFSAMPVLADALQDAGCDNEAVLTHCRDPKATHVRGCWALDRVLNRA